MNRNMTESEILARFSQAMEDGSIFLYYQPQFNHSTGRMVGAEALMRWDDPECGMQSPAVFIPVLENHGLIHRADLFAVELICRFLKELLKDGVDVVPISFNISRFDIIGHDYASEIEEVRKKYDIPVKYLRAEITESSAIGGMEPVLTLIDKLHMSGYVVEMDDFGSGYSSLNVLKDLAVDVLKLDMRFLTGDLSGRGGTIISSIVQMAKWLGSCTIAEGVETKQQADYMNSIGCCYVQGYYYSKPLKAEDFVAMLRKTGFEAATPAMKLMENLDAKKFWNPDSLETLIFSNYVGAAAIFSYDIGTGAVEILRVNAKYLKELEMNMTEQEIISSDPWGETDEESREVYEDTVKRAIETGEEETCENWRNIRSKCCGTDSICVRTSMRVLGRAGRQVIIYALVRNITAEKKHYESIELNNKIFGYLGDQTNAYAWEYDIATKDMRPCSRCRRDLGLPPLLRNYPEPVIESGLFPADYADFYRDWMKKLEQGVDNLEAVIPLTADRIPFLVRYTLERDENGRPLKAYGSATKVDQG